MATKLRAARIASAAGIETIVVGGGGEGLAALSRGEQRGTRFLASAHVPARKAWIGNQPRRGVVRIDAGAARALAAGRSLLPKGIVAVEGAFTFGSESLTRIVGRHTSDIAAVLGSKDYDEAVHRDNLALVSRSGDGSARDARREGPMGAGDSMDDA
jgi:glutamate 5-kinase